MPTLSKAAVKTIAKSAAKTPAKTSVKSAPKPATKSATLTLTPAVTKTPVKTVTSKVDTKPVLRTPIEKPIKAKKIKLVRDSFTIPKPEYLFLDNLKLRATDLKHPVKKGELIRAGIKALAAMSDQLFLAALKAVPMLKTGRPSK